MYTQWTLLVKARRLQIKKYNTLSMYKLASGQGTIFMKNAKNVALNGRS
jgi:hypothetical protein